MKIFISHSSADQQIVESSLVADLTRAKQDTWFDQELAGGEAWWARILKEIRECSVFLFALSDSSLSSKPCRAELDYAKALKLPILPVQIGSVSSYRIDPNFTMPFVDYRQATKDSGITLIAGLHECASRRTSLPDPLPQPPPVPYEYLLRLGAIIRAQADIAPSEQMSLVCELRMALEKEMEPSVHDDIRALLGVLRARNDVTYAIAQEIDAILAPTAHAQRDSSKVTAQVPSQVTSSNLVVQPVAAHPSEAPTPDHPNVATAVPVADPSAMDGFDAEAEDLFSAPIVAGEIRRLTIMFADLVDSTVLSTKVEPEVYRMLVGRYRDQVLRVVNQYEGHVGSTKGDGLLVVFGHPHPHENDVRRAVQAGLDITREVARLSEQAKRRFGAQLNVRVGIHRGPVYLDTAQDDVYGLAANLAARVSGLAPPGSTVVSDAIEPLIRHAFEVEALAPAPVKGVDGLINHFRVIGERLDGSRVMLGPLVGRDREVTRLRKTWARAQAGTSTTRGVVFRGEAGIGKSRLAAAAAELVRADGGVVLELFGSPFHPDAGLHPIRSLLERRCGISRRTDPAQRLELLRAEVTAVGLDPSAVIPLLAPVLAIGPERGYQPVAAEGRKLQDLIADAVRRYLQACLEDAPGLLVAEDVHWFDPSTKEVLGALLGDTGGRMMVVLTGRDGDWLAPDWQVKVFDLAALTAEQSEELIVALDPTVSVDERASVRDRCDGVPFYIEQVVAGMGLTSDDNRPTVPDPLYEPLFSRLLASRNVVPVVEAAAVIGRHVDRALLVAVSGLAEDEVDDVIDELEETAVLEPWGIDAWRFRHELLREVAAELAPPSVRRNLHAKVADTLVAGSEADPDWRLVAGHYERAERYADAASAYEQASGDARRRGALIEARTYLTHALTQLEKCSPGPDRDRREIGQRLERGFLASAAEGYMSPAVVADFERCQELVGTDVSDDQGLATLLAVAAFHCSRAELRRTAQLMELVQTGQDAGRQWFRPVIDGFLGMVAFLRGDFPIARSWFERAAAGVSEDETPHLEALWFIPHDSVAISHEHLAIDDVLHGDVEGAEVELLKARRRSEQLAFPTGPYNYVYAIDMEILIRVEAGQFDLAGELVTDMLERAERHGFDFWQMFGMTEQSLVSAHRLLNSGNLDSAALSAEIEAMTQWVELWRALGLVAYQTQYDCILAELLITANRLDEARARIDIGLRIAEDTGMRMYNTELLRMRARTQSHADARAADLAASIELARHQDAPLFELRSVLDDFEFRGEVARQALVDALERLPSDSVVPEVSRARALLDGRT